MQLSEASLYLQDNKQDIICSLHLQNLKHESDAVQLQIQHLKILSKGHKRFCAGTGGGGRGRNMPYRPRDASRNKKGKKRRRLIE